MGAAGLTAITTGGYHGLALVAPAGRYVTFGGGCAGSLPASRLVPLEVPRVGSLLQVRFFDLPVSTAFLVAGISRTFSSLGPLPLELVVLGMPGCFARVSPDVAVVVVGSGVQATFRMMVPGNPGLVGVRFYQQAVVPDPGAGNVAGMVVSEAVEVVVGG